MFDYSGRAPEVAVKNFMGIKIQDRRYSFDNTEHLCFNLFLGGRGIAIKNRGELFIPAGRS